MADIKLTRIPDPQRHGETLLRYEDTVTCPVCGKGARVYGYIRETSLEKAAAVKMKMGVSEEEAWSDLTLRMPHDIGIRMIYPKHWYQVFVSPYKNVIADLEKVCLGHNLRPSDGWAVLQDNEYKDMFRWVCGAECAQALVRELIEENEIFELTVRDDFIEKIMNNGQGVRK
jgi:hypothetical protein